MPHRLPPSVPAAQLLDALIRLQHDSRLRELLGPNALEAVNLRVDGDALVVDLTDPPDESSPEARTVADALQDAFARALEPPVGAPPSDPRTRSRPTRATDPAPHIIAARSHLDSGNPGRALEVVEAALPRWPNTPDLHVFHALALATLGRSAESVDAYREAIRLDPRNAFAHAGAAELCAELGRWHDALAYAKQALDLDPRDPLCLRVLALANENLGLYREAITAMQQALAIDPQLPTGKDDLARMERALAEDVEIALDEPHPVTPRPTPQAAPGDEAAYPPLDVSLEPDAPASGKPAPEPKPPPPAPEPATDQDIRWAVATHRTTETRTRECPGCEATNPASVSFCIRCGARIEPA